MTHEPYEEWLLSDEPLTLQETAELQAHLGVCAECSGLAAAWQAAVADLRAAPTLKPRPGFAGRWEARLEAERRRLHHRQSIAILSFCLAGAVILFGSLLVLAVPVLRSPNALIWTWLFRMLSVVSLFGSFENIFEGLWRLSGSIPVVIWVFAAGLLTELAVLWVVSLRLLINPRRVTQ